MNAASGLQGGKVSFFSDYHHISFFQFSFIECPSSGYLFLELIFFSFYWNKLTKVQPILLIQPLEKDDGKAFIICFDFLVKMKEIQTGGFDLDTVFLNKSSKEFYNLLEYQNMLFWAISAQISYQWLFIFNCFCMLQPGAIIIAQILSPPNVRF